MTVFDVCDGCVDPGSAGPPVCQIKTKTVRTRADVVLFARKVRGGGGDVHGRWGWSGCQVCRFNPWTLEQGITTTDDIRTSNLKVQAEVSQRFTGIHPFSGLSKFLDGSVDPRFGVVKKRSQVRKLRGIEVSVFIELDGGSLHQFQNQYIFTSFGDRLDFFRAHTHGTIRCLRPSDAGAQDHCPEDCHHRPSRNSTFVGPATGCVVG